MLDPACFDQSCEPVESYLARISVRYVVAVDAGADVTKGDATTDATVDVFDAAMDVSDGAKAKLDAPYVDLDASSVPWVQTVSNAEFYGVAVDSKLNVLVGGDINSSGSSSALASLPPPSGSVASVPHPKSVTITNHRRSCIGSDRTLEIRLFAY